MEIKNEIKKIIEYQNALLLNTERKNEAAINSLIDKISNDYDTGNFNFSNFSDVSINQMGKIRHTKMYQSFSSEEILCIYLKRLLDRKFHIKYPNRNEYMHSLFDIVNALHNMNDFVIVRFDFEDFFNSVSSEYVFKKYIINSSMERYQSELLEKFVKSTKYAYAGLNTSNIICEIIAKHFDQLLNLKFKDSGLIFYRRYIDDGILVFYKRVSEIFCLDTINETIREIFLDANIKNEHICKTKLNNPKTKYISVYDLATQNTSDKFDFLGYNFELTPTKKSDGRISTSFKYGITQKKIDKYTKKINDIVTDYKIHNNIELLRHQIKAFSHRTVYQINKYKTLIWKNKGFISNYQELRYRKNLLTDETKDFLENVIINAFVNQGLPLPYFLTNDNSESIFNLYNNMANYKTLLFVEPIGISFETLAKMCTQIGITVDGSKNYDGLVRDYLIKVKVGH